VFTLIVLVLMKLLLDQVEQDIDQFTVDGAYEKSPVYATVSAHSPDADVVIPPRANQQRT
jgi:hypothetical protein